VFAHSLSLAETKHLELCVWRMKLFVAVALNGLFSLGLPEDSQLCFRCVGGPSPRQGSMSRWERAIGEAHG
jgi:hypothetical protein